MQQLTNYKNDKQQPQEDDCAQQKYSRQFFKWGTFVVLKAMLLLISFSGSQRFSLLKPPLKNLRESPTCYVPLILKQ